MNIIYAPKGGAREYADLACNLYAGCTHGCRYCYAPAVLRKPRADFHASARPRPGVLEALLREAPQYSGDPREVLLSFTSDPYQPIEAEHGLTRRALGILADNAVRFGVLTKNPALAVRRDLDLLVRGRAALGVTAVLITEGKRQHWEPGAPPVVDRLWALDVAKAAGLRTWLSLEPVLEPREALEVIRTFAPWVGEIKIGKLNHHPDQERAVDWPKFVADAASLCQELGVRFVFKQSLSRYI